MEITQHSQKKYAPKKKPLGEAEKSIVRFMFVIAGFGIFFSLLLPFIL
jgi:hypothetical protein